MQPSTSLQSFPWFARLLTYAVLAAGALVMVLPFVWMTSTACKPPVELTQVPVHWLPDHPVCGDNLNALYDTSKYFNRYLLNSALVTIGRTLGQLVTCSLAAYGFARFPFPGRNVIFALCLGLLMVPFQAILIPGIHADSQPGMAPTRSRP
jgi:multiple sugar transport system permease protein